MSSLFGVSGSGTSGFVPRFSAASTLADSVIQDNGSTVGVGTALSGSWQLSVYDAAIGGIFSNVIASSALYASSTNNHAIQAYSANQYGIVARTYSSARGGVLGYNSTGATYGILGYGSGYSLYGVGTLYNSGSATITGNVTAAGYFHSSDASLKRDVKTAPGLSVGQRLRGTTFKFRL